MRSSAWRLKFSATANVCAVQMRSTARTPAIANGFPLNVPKCAIFPEATASMYCFLPPKAASGTPPPIDLAKQIKSG